MLYTTQTYPVQVDDVNYSNANWLDKDATAVYSTNCASLSANNFVISTISIYPNPVSSVLNIEMPQVLNQVTIYSMLGTQVLKTQSKNINIEHLKSGIYLITIEDVIGNRLTKRFIKQ